MKILVAGMGRSGSTALFNIIRLILKEKNIEFKSAYQNKHFEHGHSLIKYHDYTDSLKRHSNYIFTTKRELKDCVGSHLRYTSENKGDRPLKELCDQILHYHTIWKEHSDYEFVYENFKNNPTKVIDEVNSTFGFTKIDSNKILKQLNKLTNKIVNGDDKSGFESPTLIFNNHITNGQIGSYKEHLTDDECNWINENYSDWLKENNYLL